MIGGEDDSVDEAALAREISVRWARLRFTQLRFDRIVYGRPFRAAATRPPPDIKEIARLLRLRRPLPPFAQDWLADLLDPPANGLAEWRLIIKPHTTARRRLKTMAGEYQLMYEIAAAVQRGMGINEAIDEVMGAGRRRQGFRILKATRRDFERLRAALADSDKNQR
jgi:hypothetical protein